MGLVRLSCGFPILWPPLGGMLVAGPGDAAHPGSGSPSRDEPLLRFPSRSFPPG